MQKAPPYSITDSMLVRVASISEKIGRIGAYHNLDAKPHLRRSNRIRSIHASLRIEANSLSLGEMRDVIDGRSVFGPATEILEVKNAFCAYDRIGSFDPYCLDDLLKLHGVMEGGLISEAGTFRHGEEGVHRDGRCIFVAPPPHFVPHLMADLFAWMNASRGSVHPLIMSAVFHYEFVFIHPFADGNGRMARLWHTALLAQWQPVFEYVPIENRIEHFQEEYYAAIAACHANCNSNVFIEFMLEQTDHILDDVLDQLRRSEDMPTTYVQKLLDVMDFDVPYSAAAIMHLLGIRSRETLRKHYLDPAISLGLVSPTLPDKPTSKNQRYIKR